MNFQNKINTNWNGSSQTLQGLVESKLKLTSLVKEWPFGECFIELVMHNERSSWVLYEDLGTWG